MKLTKILFAGVCLAWLSVASFAAPRSPETVTLVAHGQARAVIVAKPDSSDQAVATEIQHYVNLLTGADLKIVSPTDARKLPATTAWVLIGNPKTNELVKEASRGSDLGFLNLKQEGFVLKTLRVESRQALVVGGNDDTGTMYAGYDAIERWGVVFLLTGDVIPYKQTSLETRLNVRSEPAFSRRGLNVWFGFANMSVMSNDQLQAFVKQMAKMKLNYLQIGWLPYDPSLKYEYHGEPKLMGDVTAKNSGYQLWRRDYGSYKTSEVPIGQEQFKKAGVYPRLESPEFQKIENNEDAYAAAISRMRAFIADAHASRIKVWLQIDATSLPPNLARYTTITADAPFHPVMASFICPNNPVSWEINDNRLKSLFETYPDVEGYFLYLPELYPVCEATEADHAFYQGQRSKYPGESGRVKVFTGDIDQKRAVDSNSGSVFLIQKLMQTRDRIAPQTKLGVAGIGRLYLLPNLDTMFPVSVPFTDMESSAVWTPTGVPMEMFAGIEGRERTLSNRIDDDSDMLGMQFNVHLYYKDHVLAGAQKYGLAGFASQVSRPRGTETNTKYMAEGEWNPQLTPEEFYEDYSGRVFGERAQHAMMKAFDLLEKNEEDLGWTGAQNFICCSAIPQLSIAYDLYKQPNPFDGPKTAYWKSYIPAAQTEMDRYSASVDTLKSALEALRSARPEVAPGARAYLLYLTNQTENYIRFLELLIHWDKAYVDLDKVFKARAQGEDRAAFVKHLDQVLDEFRQIHAESEVMATKWADSVDNPSDLATLYRIDTFLVTGTDLAADLVQSIDNFHHGREYYKQIPFDKVFVTWPVLEKQE